MSRRPHAPRALLALVLLALCGGLPLVALQPDAAAVEHVRARYTKYEYRIAMRDGARLFTQVYVPKDRTRTYPFLIMRTPYSVAPYGVDAYPSSLGPSSH